MKYRTGETATTSGTWTFVDYVEEVADETPEPNLNERHVVLLQGEVFPGIASTNQEAYWHLGW